MPVPESKRRLTSLAIGMAVLVAAPLAVVASDAFTDVPDSNVHHDDIAWLAGADVTRGCNPPQNTDFCPGAPVLRQQMASFMRRLAENQVVDAATAVTAETASSAAEAEHAATADDADSVDGFDASALASRAAFASSDDLPDEATTLNTTIEAPAEGTLVMNATVRIGEVTGSADTVLCELLVDGSAVEGTLMGSRVGGDANQDQCATTGGLVVDAGSHIVTFDIREVNTLILVGASLNAIWVPFDGAGATPKVAAGQSDIEARERSADN